MFNTYYTGPQMPAQINVQTTATQQLAPTGEHTRLLREMEQEAKDAVIGMLTFQDNVVNGRVVALNAAWKCKVEVHYLFSVNGHEYDVVEDMDAYDFQLTPQDAFNKLCDRVAAAIAQTFRTRAADAVVKET
jgi:hypothetical protein